MEIHIYARIVPEMTTFSDRKCIARTQLGSDNTVDAQIFIYESFVEQHNEHTKRVDFIVEIVIHRQICDTPEIIFDKYSQQIGTVVNAINENISQYTEIDRSWFWGFDDTILDDISSAKCKEGFDKCFEQALNTAAIFNYQNSGIDISRVYVDAKNVDPAFKQKFYIDTIVGWADVTRLSIDKFLPILKDYIQFVEDNMLDEDVQDEYNLNSRVFKTITEYSDIMIDRLKRVKSMCDH